MKLLFSILLLFAALPLRASTIMISLTGRVSATDAAAFFPVTPVSVGDPWSVRLTYNHPSPFDESQGGVGINVYPALTGSVEFQVNNLLWSGTGFRAAVGDMRDVRFSTTLNVPMAISPGGELTTFYLTFIGASGMVANPASLPESFADWNLPAASTFELNAVSRRLAAGNNLWYIRSNSWDTISIQVIPEPSVFMLTGIAALAGATRRRRVRA